MKNTEENYPQKMLRGISSFDFIKDGILLDQAFDLDPAREDGYCEISITWYDNKDSFHTIMKQFSEKRQELQFKAGAAELDRADLTRILKIHFIGKNLKYERRPTKSNKYHGNILVKDNLNKQIKRIIKCSLSSLATEIIYPNPNYIESNDEK